jgi:hypothetical protein
VPEDDAYEEHEGDDQQIRHRDLPFEALPESEQLSLDRRVCDFQGSAALSAASARAPARTTPAKFATAATLSQAAAAPSAGARHCSAPAHGAAVTASDFFINARFCQISAFQKLNMRRFCQISKIWASDQPIFVFGHSRSFPGRTCHHDWF